MSTREVIASTSTEHPNSVWVVDQTKRFLDKTAGHDERPAIVIHDRDTKFSKEFTQALQSKGVKANPLPKASSNLNGRCVHFIEIIKLECLSKFIVFRRRHLDYMVTDFVDYYNNHRSHMERDHLPPIREFPDEVVKLRFDEVEVKSYVGGLVKAFERKAA